MGTIKKIKLLVTDFISVKGYQDFLVLEEA